jgi:hypothetical protein
MAHGTRNAGEEMVGESCLPINLVCDSAVALCIFHPEVSQDQGQRSNGLLRKKKAVEKMFV